MSSPFFRRLILALIVGAACWLRVADLGSRPMHADEANQAVKAGELLESGRYVFDPRDHHGPTLYYAVLPLARLRGETTLASLSETTVRLVPALAGTLAVLLLALLVATPTGDSTDRSRHWTAAAAAAFLAVSPPAVYYSRYFIQETLLVTFTLATLVCAQRWRRSGRLSWALAAGGCAGLMQATKASAPLFIGAALVAVLLARASRPVTARPGRDLVLAAGAALAVAALFYSSFGANPAGLRDALNVYGPAWRRAGAGAGHEKPWWYYLQLFAWQKNGGLVWQQLFFSLLALIGATLALVRPRTFPRWVAVYTLIVAGALSLTPYKTPWHAVHFVPGMAILAATAIAALPRWWLAIPVAALALAAQAAQTRLAVFLRPADARNPYAYVHSSPDVLKFRPLVDAALARRPDGIVRVIGGEYWPLPWYLRGLSRVGYWSEPPADCDGAVVVTTMDYADTVRSRLHPPYRETFLGLRPGVLCAVFTRQP